MSFSRYLLHTQTNKANWSSNDICLCVQLPPLQPMQHQWNCYVYLPPFIISWCHLEELSHSAAVSEQHYQMAPIQRVLRLCHANVLPPGRFDTAFSLVKIIIMMTRMKSWVLNWGCGYMLERVTWRRLQSYKMPISRKTLDWYFVLFHGLGTEFFVS